MIKWQHELIETISQATSVLQDYKRDLKSQLVTAAAFDTETTGLHPVCDKPFLFQCGYYHEEQGKVFIVDIEKHPDVAKSFIRTWNSLTEHAPLYLGHHIIFDLHMITNIGVPYTHYENCSDTQYWIRASSDAIQESNGGESLALKDWACKHICKDANKYEKELRQYRTDIASEYNARLLKATGWSKKQFDIFFNDKLNDVDDLPDDIKELYNTWYLSLPAYLQDSVTGVVKSDMIRYSDLPRDRVIEYGYYDIEYTLQCYELCSRVVKVRETYTQVKLENEQIPVFFEMERVGFKVDKDYLLSCKHRTKEYTLKRRKDLELLAKQPISCHQNALILKILKEQYGYDSDAANKETLELLVGDIKHRNPDDEAIEFIETILELRSLEKWYSTYIRKFDYQLKLSSRIYTSISQVGAVSGRITCDFQQFPKGGLVDNEGNELFDPRRMVVVDDEFNHIVYLDYSAQELRVTALYTYLVGAPDLNMMRAYCPWKCHLADGTKFDCEDAEMRSKSYTEEWFRDEDNVKWVPTDLHGAMTKTIFDIDESDPTFHDKRYVGKRCNFLKNYGGSFACIRQAFPDFSDELCHKIDEAYYNTFPGVKAYHNYCFQIAESLPCATNLYGVKYYGVNGHHLRNVLVQGTCAYMTKNRQVALTKFLKEHNMKSKFVIPIHDEVQIYWHKDDDLRLAWELKKVMQDIDSQVPIVSDMEITDTNWKEKYEVGTYEELLEICNRS